MASFSRVLICCFLVFPVYGFSTESPNRLQSRLDDSGTLHFFSTSPKKPGSTCSDQLPYFALISRYAALNRLDPCFIAAIISVESDFRSDAVSTSGAMGLMQLMQDTARQYGVRDPLDPEENIRAGTAHLAWLVGYFKGDLVLAVAAYHAGLGAVAKRMALPPIESTEAYVKEVMKRYDNRKVPDGRVKKLYSTVDDKGTIRIEAR